MSKLDCLGGSMVHVLVHFLYALLQSVTTTSVTTVCMYKLPGDVTQISLVGTMSSIMWIVVVVHCTHQC